MKRTMGVFAAATLMTTLAFAAPDGGERGHGRHGMRGEGMQHRGAHLERMAERLGLSEAQKVQMRELRESFRAETEPQRTAMHETMKQLREARQAEDTARAQQLAATLEGQRAQIRELRKAQHERMLALLTAEQRAKVEEMQAQREQRRGERRGRRGGREHRGGADRF